MKPEEYIANAVLTESCDWDSIAERFARMPRALHAALGIANEGGEVAGVIKKALFYGKYDNNDALLREKVVDECGDVLWYMAILFDAMGITFEEVFQYNAEKLSKRYGGGPFDATKVGGTNG